MLFVFGERLHSQSGLTVHVVAVRRSKKHRSARIFSLPRSLGLFHSSTVFTKILSSHNLHSFVNDEPIHLLSFPRQLSAAVKAKRACPQDSRVMKLSAAVKAQTCLPSGLLEIRRGGRWWVVCRSKSTKCACPQDSLGSCVECRSKSTKCACPHDTLSDGPRFGTCYACDGNDFGF
jgi:hypothetical protein